MTYCISDIHGEYELCMRLLEKIKYTDSDKLIVCGDMIEKGEDSVRLAKLLFGLPNVYCLMGNHEFAFFKFYRSRMHSAVMDYDAILWHLQQYFPKDGSLLDWETVDRLVEMPYYHEEDDFICVHAGVKLDKDGHMCHPQDTEPELLVNDRRFKEPDVLPLDAKCVLFGHTPTTYLQNEARILAYPRSTDLRGSSHIADYYKIHLDTGTPFNGVLGCFCTDTCRAFYVTRT